MTQDQELIGLQNDLVKNLNLQENLKLSISLKEQELSGLENEQESLEEDILELNCQLDIKKEQVFNEIVNDILKDIDVNLDKNEQGETIQ